jgi:hypothetical protein
LEGDVFGIAFTFSAILPYPEAALKPAWDFTIAYSTLVPTEADPEPWVIIAYSLCAEGAYN